MRLTLTIGVVFGLIAACTHGGDVTGVAAPGQPQLSPEMGVVLPNREAARLLGFPWGKAEEYWGATAVWTPPSRIIAQLEDRLPAEFLSTLDRAVLLPEDPAARVQDYYRQYAGFRRRDGSHGILVRGAARLVIDHIDSLTRERRARGDRVYVPNWREEAFWIADGGLLSFRAVYSVERQAFDSLRFNPRFGGRVEMRPEP